MSDNNNRGASDFLNELLSDRGVNFPRICDDTRDTLGVLKLVKTSHAANKAIKDYADKLNAPEGSVSPADMACSREDAIEDLGRFNKALGQVLKLDGADVPAAQAFATSSHNMLLELKIPFAQRPATLAADVLAFKNTVMAPANGQIKVFFSQKEAAGLAEDARDAHKALVAYLAGFDQDNPPTPLVGTPAGVLAFVQTPTQLGLEFAADRKADVVIAHAADVYGKLALFAEVYPQDEYVVMLEAVSTAPDVFARIAASPTPVTFAKFVTGMNTGIAQAQGAARFFDAMADFLDKQEMAGLCASKLIAEHGDDA
jgi:hypothetical protein